MSNYTLDLSAGQELEIKNFLNAIFATQRTLIRICGAEGEFKVEPGKPEPATMTVRYTESAIKAQGPMGELEDMFFRLAGSVKAITRTGSHSDVLNYVRAMKEIMAQEKPDVAMTSLLDEREIHDIGNYRIVLTFTTDDQYIKVVLTDGPWLVADPRLIRITMQTTRGELNLSI